MTLTKRGGGAQVRATRRDGWTKARRAEFLEMLSTTCNVRRAAAAAGMSTENAYALRRRDGEFAQLWAKAFDHGTELLREAVISRALGQVASGDNPDFEPTAPEAGVFDAKFAMEVLKMQNGWRRKREAGVAPPQVEVDEALLKRLKALALALAAR